MILRGSDPLPIKHQEKKAGSFGFCIENNIDLDYPLKSVNNLLLHSQVKHYNYGKFETILKFFPKSNNY